MQVASYGRDMVKITNNKLNNQVIMEPEQINNILKQTAIAQKVTGVYFAITAG